MIPRAMTTWRGFYPWWVYQSRIGQSRVRGQTQTPSTLIRIFSSPQIFLCGFISSSTRCSVFKSSLAVRTYPDSLSVRQLICKAVFSSHEPMNCCASFADKIVPLSTWVRSTRLTWMFSYGVQFVGPTAAPKKEALECRAVVWHNWSVQQS